ncbi:MAG: T9SS type A sorting domain-containing protein [Bacteroidetes bacterium]|nr:T9SS type A sorting domain-containing protein [Bacteroidota bacterium]
MKKIYALLIYILCNCFITYAQTPYLLKDIISGPAGGFAESSQYAYYEHPFSVVWEKNGIIYFTAVGYNTVPNGGSYTNDIELWMSDGTNGGTVLVKDINPGNDGSYPADFKEINGTLYFTAYSSSSGRELWKTDGTSGGTQIVKDIISGNVGGFSTSAQFGYYTHPFSVVWQNGGSFYFTANNNASGPGGSTDDMELWKSDGTDAGTVMVKDIYPGIDGSYPQDFYDINGTLYFTARNPANGRELWKSDGTNGGTQIVKDIISGNVGGFSTSAQFGYYTHPFAVVWQHGGSFFFTANNNASGPGGSTDDIELWMSDGTDGGTVMVKDIYSGIEGSYPQDFYDINGTLYFTARNPTYGRELWKSDGTNGGTQIVKDIISGSVGGFSTSAQFGYYTYAFSVVWQNGGSFYFTANNNASGPGGSTDDIELWKSDGTSGGTVMVKDIYSGIDGSYPQDFRDINGTLYFTANNPSSGRELWKSDGTNGGTQIVKEIISGNVGGFQTSGQFGYYTFPFSVVWQNGGTFYFTANNNASGPGGSTDDIELWKSDGTSGGTVMVKDINPGIDGSYPTDFTNMNGTLYFTAYDNISGRELWRTDGSNGGTTLVADIMNGNVGGFQTASQYAYYTWPFSVGFNIGSDFYFTANDYATVPNGGTYDNNIELWKSDGTPGGTSKVIEIYSSTTNGSYPMYFTNTLGKIFFTAVNDVYGRELWVIDYPVSDGPELTATNDWKIFPNPSRNNMQIFYNSSDPANVPENISITDLNGREVYHDELEGSKSFFNKNIDISSLNSGIYLVKLRTSKVTEVRKIVKE